MESMEMQQKAHDEWLIFGGTCSKYFRKFLQAKKNKSAIVEVIDLEGTNYKGKNGLVKAFITISMELLALKIF